jgi:hypothetical protein
VVGHAWPLVSISLLSFASGAVRGGILKDQLLLCCIAVGF